MYKKIVYCIVSFFLFFFQMIMEECKIKDKGYNKKEKYIGERSVLFFYVVMLKFKVRKK